MIDCLSTPAPTSAYLISQGAEIEAMDNQGMTVLHASAMDGNYDMTVWLLMRVTACNRV